MILNNSGYNVLQTLGWADGLPRLSDDELLVALAQAKHDMNAIGANRSRRGHEAYPPLLRELERRTAPSEA